MLALPAALDVLASRSVRRQVMIDVPAQLRPLRARVGVGLSRLGALGLLYMDFRRSRSRAAGREQVIVTEPRIFRALHRNLTASGPD